MSNKKEMIDTSRLSFLGTKGLRALHEGRVCVVGVGGGGSHAAQQLAHLAVGCLYLIDNDRLETSNVNRVVGVTYCDVGIAKASILSRRLANLGGCVVTILERAEEPRARAAIESSDFVIGALDSYRARHNLEKRCRAALVPYIDIGLRIIVGDGRVTAVGGQVFTSLPGGPCLQCVSVVTEETLASDREEYVAGAPDQQVVSMNGILASQAVNTVVALMSNYGGEYRPPSYLAYDGLRHELRRHPVFPKSDVCRHYDVGDAGYRHMLPPRRANIEHAVR